MIVIVMIVIVNIYNRDNLLVKQININNNHNNNNHNIILNKNQYN
jgi:hypothetical protein